METLKSNKWWLILGLVLLALWLVFAPPRFIINLTKRVDLSDSVTSGAQVVKKYGCRNYHTIGGSGVLMAPDLAGGTQRHGELTLRLWLKDPKAVKRNTAMPNFKLSDSEIEAIVQYLSSLDQ